ncbi:MAG: SDR family NAD(P)-dependent oxidoreductase [Halieaceae bacterium]|nr:SDR family NAD(P)-dependent oxidoreductase [Halieaceae bacterium]
MMNHFKDRVAVVTGAASGIGLATATCLAAEGMNVVLADIQEDALEAAVSTLQKSGYEVHGVITDVSKPEQIQALADETVAHYGKVNVVHNNAGVVRAGSLEELSLEDWYWVMNVDLWSVIHGVRIFLPLVKASGEGHIVNTASSAGLQATPNIGPYNVAKFGVIALTETLKLELNEAQSPIGASVLCPGAVATRICESDRNREATGIGAGKRSDTESSFKKAAGVIVDAGLPPTQVAELVVAAIRSGAFWILPHRQWIDVMRERVGGMESGGLVTGFGG